MQRMDEKGEMMIHIIIADDHQLLRNYLKRILERREDICIVAEAADGSEVIRCVQESPADLLLLDIEMPGMNGIEVLRYLQQQEITIKALVLSGYSDRELIQGALDLGAQGYLIKDEAHTHLFEAIDTVYESKNVWLSDRAASALI